MAAVLPGLRAGQILLDSAEEGARYVRFVVEPPSEREIGQGVTAVQNDEIGATETLAQRLRGDNAGKQRERLGRYRRLIVALGAGDAPPKASSSIVFNSPLAAIGWRISVSP